MATIQTDASLQWVDYEPIAAKIPQDIFYQSTTADTGSSSGFSFYIITPASNALLDNEAYVEHTVTISATGTTLSGLFEGGVGGSSNNAPYAGNNMHCALRQCWPICRAIQNLSVNINGTVISNQPYIWMDAMNRLYLSEEEASNICTLSGGEFDTGYRIPLGNDNNYATCYADIALSGQAENLNIKSNYGFNNVYANGVATANAYFPLHNLMPLGDTFENNGFSKRFYRIARKAREAINPASVTSTARYADTITFSVFERIPISPFLLYDSRDYHMSIPHVRTMTIAAQYSTKYKELAFQYPTNLVGNADYSSNSTAFPTIDFTNSANKPILHLKWIMSKDIIPPNISIPCNMIREYANAFTMPEMATTAISYSSTTAYSNINLEGIPDLMLVYIRRNPADTMYRHPSEHFLGIDQLKITIAGTSGKMNNISSGELYALWLKNVVHRGIYKQGYEDWYRLGCVAALRPKDYGCLFGPGMDYPVQVSLDISYTNNNVIPAYLNNTDPYYLDNTGGVGTLSYVTYMVCVYQRYSLSLNSGGGSKLSLLKIPLVNDAVMGEAPMKVNA